LRGRLVVRSAGFGSKGPPKGKPATKSAIQRNEMGSKFDQMAADGAPIYAVFVRAAGPNQVRCPTVCLSAFLPCS
jgi:hypothetical protein